MTEENNKQCNNTLGKFKTQEEIDMAYQQIARLEQENKELKKDVQLFKCLDTFGESECHCACRCLGNEFCEDADKKINNYRSALKEIRNYCDRIEQGSVIGTQDCLINSIKNIVNYTINEVQDEGK